MLHFIIVVKEISMKHLNYCLNLNNGNGEITMNKSTKKRIKAFKKKRCCNHNINLFCIFLSEKYKGQTAREYAILITVNNGLPFIDKDKKTWIKNKNMLNL
ncbi:hypothetical protein RFI_01404 [Reticulomyxa filosa]|uniref:Uncharacterized protein n=1 Tax=Reticulomyxa filosa TaxID=46433 RepID=X6PC68_RETFI|nr:hypothetical protein RFI_01404 [Reticulomyxa filosa]|eukprot:ETO35659.1 hypothetical protein RFI_01404 [Reticulomyxa filosa]